MKNKRGRPKKHVNLDAVHILRANKWSFQRIADKLCVSRSTLIRAIKNSPERCSLCAGKYGESDTLGILAQFKKEDNSSYMENSSETSEKSSKREAYG